MRVSLRITIPRTLIAAAVPPVVVSGQVTAHASPAPTASAVPGPSTGRPTA